MGDSKYWHELTAREYNKIKHNTLGWLLKNYKQPDWCDYPDAIEGCMGCWSLFFSITVRKGYKRISRNFCKNCDEYIKLGDSK